MGGGALPRCIADMTHTWVYECVLVQYVDVCTFLHLREGVSSYSTLMSVFLVVLHVKACPPIVRWCMYCFSYFRKGRARVLDVYVKTVKMCPHTVHVNVCIAVCFCECCTRFPIFR